MIRVLLVDDHALVRTGFRLLLHSHSATQVVGEADSGESACERYLELTPDVVVMDLAMPGMGGLELIEAITTVAAGQRYLDVSLAHRLALQEVDGGEKSGVASLSEREFEVFLRLAAGHTVQRIAEDLKLSTSTVGTHLYNVKQKLGASNQAELTLIAIRHRLIEP
ncbi:MAG: response regulator transcription factor [Gammaproteobacteria bacterium]|nr:MAG: response regulator transcription factor [Gammaproteobacteria bacterium]